MSPLNAFQTDDSFRVEKSKCEIVFLTTKELSSEHWTNVRIVCLHLNAEPKNLAMNICKVLQFLENWPIICTQYLHVGYTVLSRSGSLKTFFFLKIQGAISRTTAPNTRLVCTHLNAFFFAESKFTRGDYVKQW